MQTQDYDHQEINTKEKQTMRREYTAEQKAATEARRERFRGFVKQIGKMTDEQRKVFADKMPVIVTADGHPLSGPNMMLVALQCPGVTVVGGFRQWLKHGRAVRKGEHGAMIWFPKAMNQRDTEPTTHDPETNEVRFLIGTVFDISQTEEIQQPSEVTA
jgi:hypothetical protein